MSFKEACLVLNVSVDGLTQDAAKKARNKLLLKYHLDKNQVEKETAIKKSQEIITAYEILESSAFNPSMYKESSTNHFSDSSPFEDSPLHNAAKYGGVDDIKEELKKGSDINTLNNQNITAIYIAVIYGRDNAVVDFLVDQGANINDLELLKQAAKKGYHNLIDKIMSQSVIINSKERAEDKTKISDSKTLQLSPSQLVDLLCDAVLYNNFWVVKLFVEKYKVDVNGYGMLLNTATKTAIHKSNKDMIDFLSSLGGKIEPWEQKSFFDLKIKVPSCFIKDHWLNDTRSKLIEYIENRKSAEKSSSRQFYLPRHILSFFTSIPNAYSAQTKINAAEKILKFMDNEKDVTLTKDELLAIKEGKLSSIIQGCKEIDITKTFQKKIENIDKFQGYSAAYN